MRHQRAPGGLADVVVAGVVERGVEQRVELVGAPGERLEPDVDEDRRAARVGHVGLGDPPAPGARGVDLAVGEAARVGEPGGVPGVLALALGERLAVGHHELEVADAGRADVGRVDLGQLTVVERQPGLARRAGRGAHPVLVALGPGRDLARCAGRVGGARGAGEGEQRERADRQEASEREPHRTARTPSASRQSRSVSSLPNARSNRSLWRWAAQRATDTSASASRRISTRPSSTSTCAPCTDWSRERSNISPRRIREAQRTSAASSPSRASASASPSDGLPLR